MARFKFTQSKEGRKPCQQRQFLIQWFAWMKMDASPYPGKTLLERFGNRVTCPNSLGKRGPKTNAIKRRHQHYNKQALQIFVVSMAFYILNFVLLVLYLSFYNAGRSFGKRGPKRKLSNADANIIINRHCKYLYLWLFTFRAVSAS